jgi:uncharacterized protein
MTAWRIKTAALLLMACMAWPASAAESTAPIADLQSRAEAGDRMAMHALAESFYVGRDGVAQDFAKAADWYGRLARLGDARAQTSLGLMHARGYGVPKNLATAHRWWNFAAAQNDPGAQYNLGLTYVQGEGVTIDYARAARWFREAAQRGHVQAQHNLGMLYYEGKGVPRDPVNAYYWVRVAALQGDRVATESLGKIGDGMSAEQITEAESLARAWMTTARKTLQ